MLNRFWNNTSTTLRITLALVAVLCGVVTLFIGARSALAASLKPISIITADVITVGDIFNGVKNNADYVIGGAPQPGQDLTLNARTLYRIATAMDLNWRPLSTSDQVVVRREASVVSFDTIEKSLRESLSKKGANGNFNINLNTGKPTMVLPNDLPNRVEVSSITFDPQKDYFQATLVAPSIDNPVQKLSVSGLVERMVKVPVLRANLQNGDVIGLNDIQMIDMPQNKLDHGILLKEEDIIGMTPRRIAYAGKFLQSGALERPQLVGRGDSVSITFTNGPLVLTAKGKALQSGAAGDLVRVTNANSSKTIDAFVTGSNEVIVR